MGVIRLIAVGLLTLLNVPAATQAGHAGAIATQSPGPGVYRRTLAVPGAEPLRYTLSLPRGYNGTERRPLVLALHPGGPPIPNYGGRFMAQVIVPALYEFDPIIIAPDVPTRSWTDPASEQAVLALVRYAMEEFSVDRRRVLVTGFSLGGRGTWFLSARHATLFTAAIVMAGSPAGQPIANLGRIPTYVIHSRADEVVPFEPAERTTAELVRMGRAVHFEALDWPGHYEMSEYIEPLERGARWVVQRWNR